MLPLSSSLEESVCILGLGPRDLLPFRRFSEFLSAKTIVELYLFCNRSYVDDQLVIFLRYRLETENIRYSYILSTNRWDYTNVKFLRDTLLIPRATVESKMESHALDNGMHIRKMAHSAYRL